MSDVCEQTLAALKEHIETAGLKHAFMEPLCVILPWGGRNGYWNVIVRIDDTPDTLYCSVECPIRTPENRRVPMAEFLSRANWGLILGAFSMNMSTGQILFSVNLPLGSSAPAPDDFYRPIRVVCQMIDRYLPGVMRVIQGASARIAVNQCEKNETPAKTDQPQTTELDVDWTGDEPLAKPAPAPTPGDKPVQPPTPAAANSHPVGLDDFAAYKSGHEQSKNLARRVWEYITKRQGASIRAPRHPERKTGPIVFEPGYAAIERIRTRLPGVQVSVCHAPAEYHGVLTDEQCEALQLKPGRPGWSRFTVSNELQLDAVFKLLDRARELKG